MRFVFQLGVEREVVDWEVVLFLFLFVFQMVDVEARSLCLFVMFDMFKQNRKKHVVFISLMTCCSLLFVCFVCFVQLAASGFKVFGGV